MPFDVHDTYRKEYEFCYTSYKYFFVLYGGSILVWYQGRIILSPRLGGAAPALFASTQLNSCLSQVRTIEQGTQAHANICR